MNQYAVAERADRFRVAHHETKNLLLDQSIASFE